MQVEPAPLGLFEVKGKGIQLHLAAQPYKAVLPHLDVGLEDVLIFLPGHGRDTVGGDHQIIVVGILIGREDFSLKNQLYAQPGCASLKDLQQLDPSDAAEAVAAGSELGSLEVNVDVVPVAKCLGNFSVGLFVDTFEAIHGLVGKHDAPTKSIVAAVTLDDRDVP